MNTCGRLLHPVHHHTSAFICLCTKTLELSPKLHLNASVNGAIDDETVGTHQDLKARHLSKNHKNAIDYKEGT